MNPYFTLETPQVVGDVETLLSLNTQKDYSTPGEPRKPSDTSNALLSWHRTAGLFRGQVRDWPLVPQAWRSLPYSAAEGSSIERIVRSTTALGRYRRFCERAQAQNPSFPSLELERMCIAQHFGVPTPLLDWSQTVFAAVFFSIRELLDRPEVSEDPHTFIYHIVDERLLAAPAHRDASILMDLRSSFVGPFYADRRIERQKGVFTYHPDPICNPPKVPVRVYVLEVTLIMKLQKLMEGLGFTYDYFFPDYAGIAQAVTTHEGPWL